MVIVISIYYTVFLPQRQSDGSPFAPLALPCMEYRLPSFHSHKAERASASPQGHLTDCSQLESTDAELHHSSGRQGCFCSLFFCFGVPAALWFTSVFIRQSTNTGKYPVLNESTVERNSLVERTQIKFVLKTVLYVC